MYLIETAEDLLKMQLGDAIFRNATLQTENAKLVKQLEAATAENAKLVKQLEAAKDDQD